MTAILTCFALPLQQAVAAPGKAAGRGRKRVDASGWILPVARARERARQLGKPLLIFSINGNLDGYC